LDIAPTLSEYGVYVGNFKNCNSTLLRLKEENSAFTALVQRVDRTQGASLSALLSQPVNHISKLCTDIEVRSFILPLVRFHGSSSSHPPSNSPTLQFQVHERPKTSLVHSSTSQPLLAPLLSLTHLLTYSRSHTDSLHRLAFVSSNH